MSTVRGHGNTPTPNKRFRGRTGLCRCCRIGGGDSLYVNYRLMDCQIVNPVMNRSSIRDVPAVPTVPPPMLDVLVQIRRMRIVD